jgi:hypothetical protein
MGSSRAWLAAREDCAGTTGGLALLVALNRGFAVSSGNYGTSPAREVISVDLLLRPNLSWKAIRSALL